MPYYGKQDPYNRSEAARRMIAACNRQRWHIATSLLDFYEDDIVHVRGIGNYDCTPLHAAAASGQADLLLSLLDHGAEVDAPATHGYTPLYMAVRNNRPNAVRLLLHAGADPDIRCGGVTPLLTAVEKGFQSIVASLLDAGASTYVENSGGDQALHTAARLGYVDIVQALVEAGSDVNMRGARGLTPVQVANEAGNYDISDYLRSGHVLTRNECHGRLVPYNGGSFSEKFSEQYGDYDVPPFSQSRYGRDQRMNRLWDRQGYSGYGYGLGLGSPCDDRYERHYGYGSRHRSRSMSRFRTEWNEDLRHGRGYGHGYGHGYCEGNAYPKRMNSMERYSVKRYGSDDVVELIGDFVGRRMSHSNKRRLMRRVERNADKYGISRSMLMWNGYDAKRIARKLVMDSSGYCSSEDLRTTMAFIRAFRDGGRCAY